MAIGLGFPEKIVRPIYDSGNSYEAHLWVAKYSHYILIFLFKNSYLISGLKASYIKNLLSTFIV